ncbi:hypothetical protein AMTRI_Chr10g5830 [Amborella trichopoda]|uniref:Knottins-like domain-containing protein n=1 Tax=Amborella trichopoda TaxID=13333 RepID=W1NRH0_AMBTC|nr:hypothetical protein AMTR_s00088p00131130 [Amborella trichopoda]
MAMTVTPNKFSVLFLVLLLILASEFRTGDAKVCQKKSQTWSGECGNTNHCKTQCQKYEDARFGACHSQGFGHACFCYFTC